MTVIYGDDDSMDVLSQFKGSRLELIQCACSLTQGTHNTVRVNCLTKVAVFFPHNYFYLKMMKMMVEMS